MDEVLKFHFEIKRHLQTLRLLAGPASQSSRGDRDSGAVLKMVIYGWVNDLWLGSRSPCGCLSLSEPVFWRALFLLQFSHQLEALLLLVQWDKNGLSNAPTMFDNGGVMLLLFFLPLIVLLHF